MMAFAEGLEMEYKKNKESKDNSKIIDLSSNHMSVRTSKWHGDAWGRGRSVY